MDLLHQGLDVEVVFPSERNLCHDFPGTGGSEAPFFQELPKFFFPKFPRSHGVWAMGGSFSSTRKIFRHGPTFMCFSRFVNAGLDKNSSSKRKPESADSLCGSSLGKEGVFSFEKAFVSKNLLSKRQKDIIVGSLEDLQL
jgi:hypothetical protein